jgi:hypothetical protein
MAFPEQGQRQDRFPQHAVQAPKSTVFIVDCQFGDGHIVKCQLLEATVLQAS